MSSDDAAMHPIIYVRGYAMTQREIDETTADPFCPKYRPFPPQEPEVQGANASPPTGAAGSRKVVQPIDAAQTAARGERR